MHQNDSAEERWLPIQDWDGYEVSSHGRVRSWKKSRRHPNHALPRLLNTYVLPHGYHCLKLKDRGRRRNAYIHRLVLEAFNGPPSPGQECRHLNGDASDNRLANLAWGTKAENQKDIDKHGTRVRGERHHLGMTRATAEAILNHPGTHAEAARAYGVRYGRAYAIRTRRTWKHI